MKHPMRNNTRLGGHLSEREANWHGWRAALVGFALSVIAYGAAKLMA